MSDEIFCDRCQKRIEHGDWGNCDYCEDDLCIDCAGHWNELPENDEHGDSVCDRCFAALGYTTSQLPPSAVDESFTNETDNVCRDVLAKIYDLAESGYDTIMGIHLQWVDAGEPEGDIVPYPHIFEVIKNVIERWRSGGDDAIEDLIDEPPASHVP